MSQRYQNMFERLQLVREGAFVPFVTLGDPDPVTSMKIIDTLIENGADALELGIPFSDPVADGPTIQGATIRALNSGTTPAVCFEMLKTLRMKYPNLPVGLLLYANLVFAGGMEQFFQRCANAGVDSVLIADVPIEMSEPFMLAAKKSGISSIFVAPPNADEETLKAIAINSSGYTYLLSRAGVTGVETEAEMPVRNLINTLKKYDAPPSLLGFGISKPQQVNAAIESGAAGVITGSATVRIIEENIAASDMMLDKLARYIASMKAATRLDLAAL